MHLGLCYPYVVATECDAATKTERCHLELASSSLTLAAAPFLEIRLEICTPGAVTGGTMLPPSYVLDNLLKGRPVGSHAVRPKP